MTTRPPSSPVSALRLVLLLISAALVLAFFAIFFHWLPHGVADGFAGNACLVIAVTTSFFAMILYAGIRALQRAALAARRRAQGLCPSCAYDRSGLDNDALCPECGSKP